MGLKLVGTVVQGRGEGRTTGYPTANLVLVPGVERPAPGIYACWVFYQRQRFPGALVSGVHWEEKQPRIEVHLIGYVGDLYGQVLELEVMVRIRDTMELVDLTSLQQRIADDIVAVRTALGL